jgi:putative MATE family efflux protein
VTPASPAAELRRAALPVFAGLVSQNVFNLAEAALIGRLGSPALAAAGVATFAHFVAMALVSGLAVGVQARSARRLGEGPGAAPAAAPLGAALGLCLAIGVPAAAALWVLAPRLLALFSADPAVVALAVPLWRARLAALPAVGFHFAFGGWWNGVGLHRLYLRGLLVFHGANLALDGVLLFGLLGAPALGLVGAGVANAAATFLVVACHLAWGRRRADGAGLRWRPPPAGEVATLVRVSAPAGLQQLLFAAGSAAFLGVVGRLGTAELAAAHVLLNLSLAALLPGMSLGVAAASRVGRALGGGDAGAALAWGWRAGRWAAVATALLALPAVAAPGWLLGLFFAPGAAWDLARLPLRLTGLAAAADGLAMALMNAHRGAGATRWALVVTAGLQLGVGLPLAWLLGPALGRGLTEVWAAQLLYRVLQALVFARSWSSKRWIAESR